MPIGGGKGGGEGDEHFSEAPRNIHTSLRVPLRQSGYWPTDDSSHSHQQHRPRPRAYVLAGRTSACFFESARAWLSCRRSPALVNGRYRSSLGEDTASWDAPSTTRRKLRALISQGLLHSIFFTVGFVCFPSIYVIYIVIPMVSREWAIDLARWIGLRSVSQTEQIIKFFLTATCTLLLALTLVALLATAFIDPGRVPKKYHWITTAVRCAPVAPLSNVPASQRRQSVAQSLGLGVNDVAAHDMMYHSSSFCPSLHLTGCLPPSADNNERAALEASSSIIEDSTRGRRKSRIYMSYKSVRVWQALILSEDRASLWSFTPHDESIEGAPTNKGSEVDLEIPTDLNGLCDGVRLRLKWCAICQHVRLPRTRHCTSCQCCVDRFDHHCVWVCNCIGLRNHRYFVAFVFCACTLNSLILLLCVSSYHELWQQTGHQVGVADETDHWWSHASLVLKHHWILIKMVPVMFLLMVTTFLLFFPLINLILFHAVLVASNRTTTEEMRELYLVKNPFSLGCKRNIYHLLFAPVPPSLTDRWGNPKQLKHIDTQMLLAGDGFDGVGTTDLSYLRALNAPYHAAASQREIALTRDLV